MIKRLADSTTVVLADAKGYVPETLDYDKLHYGVYVFFTWLINSVLILSFAAMFHVFFHVAVMYLAYGSLRRASYGVHLYKAWHCTVVSIGCYLLGLTFSLNVILPLWITVLLLLAGLVSFLKYAPAETKKRPLSDVKKKQLKPLAVSVCISTAILCAGAAACRIPVASNLLLSAILIQSFNITPLSYKIFERSENT